MEQVVHTAITATQAEVALLTAVLAPLFGAGAAYVLPSCKKEYHGLSGWIATAASVISLICVICLWYALPSHSSSSHSSSIVAELWTWIDVLSVSANFGFRFDALSGVMALVVTGVGSLIHLYAIGYMSHDEHRPRFFSYLNLFMFFMMVLVLADNLLVMFVGWEGVGLCSYLLIGFWFADMANAKAGQKAFVVNRIGDAGFLLGMFLLLYLFGSLDFRVFGEEMSSVVQQYPMVIEIAALLLLLGATGKSAQIPLFVWLPDAMAGPTPVSALIHAATMVTAGVYMIARLQSVFISAPIAMSVVLIIGTATAFVAATIALVQTDIKKVLAYSTISQLGYMFMALGVGAFSNGVYHVATHALFKGCLFMGAGSVIVGCHHEQDMRKYGGLRKMMPLTFVGYLAASLAIAGVPFTSGFYSKDAILWSVLSSTGLAKTILVIPGVSVSDCCWALGLFTAFLTAIYSMRVVMLTFMGEYRGKAHPKESPWTMTVPILILAAGALCFAMLFGHDVMHALESWTRKDLLVGHEVLAHDPRYNMAEMIASIVAMVGVAIGCLMYTSGLSWMPWWLRPSGIARIAGGTYRLFFDKWWIDELYNAVVICPLRILALSMFRVLDRGIDGAVGVVGSICIMSGQVVKTIHMGQISFYAVAMLAGSLCIIIPWLF